MTSFTRGFRFPDQEDPGFNQSSWIHGIYIHFSRCLGASEKKRIIFTEDQPQVKKGKKDDWSRLASVKSYLKSLELKTIKNDGPEYWPGIPSCIMTLYMQGDGMDVIMSSTADKFRFSLNLAEAALQRHTNLLSSYHHHHFEEAQKRVNAVEQFSNDLMIKTENDKGYTREELKQILATLDSKTSIPVKLSGLLATWAPNSNRSKKERVVLTQA